MTEQHSDRGTGRTTEQMKAAPKGAIFIWCNDRTYYPKHLAHHLGRDDLQILPASVLQHRGGRLYGLRVSGMVLDHAFVDVQWPADRAAEYIDTFNRIAHSIVRAPEFLP